LVAVLALCLAVAWETGAGVRAQRSGEERRAEAPVGDLIPRVLGTPDVALGDDGYLVVWIDQRIGGGPQPMEQLLGARVTPDGRVLDPRGFAIATVSALRRDPRVAASESGFIVLWREGSLWGGEESRFARVDSDGRVLDPGGTPLPLRDAIALGCAGAHCLAASAPVVDLRALGFDACGGTGMEIDLAIPPRTGSHSGATATEARIASTACGHWLAFAKHDERMQAMSIALFGFAPQGDKRFGRSAQQLPEGTNVLPALALAPNAAEELLLVWQQPAPGSSRFGPAADSGELWSLRVDQSGEPLSDAQRLMDGTSPALAFDGHGFVLIAGSEVLSAHRLGEDGAVLERDPVVVRAEPPGLRGPARVAAGPNGALVVWAPKSVPIANERNVARLGADGELLDPDGLAVAASANRQRAPRLARNGDGYLLLFHDDRPDRAGILSARLDERARSLGASTRVLAGAFRAGDEPRLFTADARHALMWSEEARQFLSWLDDASVPTEPTLLTLHAPASGAPGLFVPGSGSILAIGEHQGLLCGEDQQCDVALSIQLLRPDGSPDDAMPAVMLGPDGEFARSAPIAAFDGQGFVVAFTQTRVDSGARDSSVRALRVELDGSIGTGPQIVSRPPEGSHDEPRAIAPSTGGALLVFARTDASSALPRSQALFGVRLREDGSAAEPEPFPIATASAERSHLCTADDGEAWLLVWQERIAGGSWDIRGARIPFENDGAPVTFGVAVSPLDELAPALAALAPDRALVAYERFDTDPEVMTGRVFLRDLFGTTPCDDPECCDGECRAPAPASCEPAASHDEACEEHSDRPRSARYDCGCRTVSGARPPLTGTLLLLCATRLLRRIAVKRR
jgi:hypothetical protein